MHAASHGRVSAEVTDLVYIAAHGLDEGETEVANGKKFPKATKAGPKNSRP